MPERKITVAVGGGHELDRAARAALLSSQPGLHVVSLENNPQVLVWEMRTEADGLPVVPSGTAVLLLTEQINFDRLPATILGLFSPDESPAALGVAIRQVARGEQYLSPNLATALLERRQASTLQLDSTKKKVDELSAREREILNLLSEGLSNKMIAARLYLSVRTIEGHLANIYSRLGVHSRTEAMLVAVQIR
jgi:DNA-binding CsgD family transcriptional regulator